MPSFFMMAVFYYAGFAAGMKCGSLSHECLTHAMKLHEWAPSC